MPYVTQTVRSHFGDDKLVIVTANGLPVPDNSATTGSLYMLFNIYIFSYFILFYNQQGIALRRRKNTESNRKILKPKSYTLLSTKDRKMQSKTIKE